MRIYVEEINGGSVEVPDDIGLESKSKEDIERYLTDNRLWPLCDEHIETNIVSVAMIDEKEEFI